MSCPSSRRPGTPGIIACAPIDHVVVLPQRSEFRYRALVIAGALLFLSLLWIDVWIDARWYPSWLYLGSVTLSVTEVPAVTFALLVGVRLRHRREAAAGWSRLDWVAAALVGLTLLAAVYAAASLNLGQPGVYVAGVLPVAVALLLGVVEAVGVWLAYRR